MFILMKYRRVVKSSGLTKAELASLYGVSRQTVYDWWEAGPRPLSLNERMAEVITIALTNAMDLHLLPLPDMTVGLRHDRVEAMRRVLQNLKPAPVR